MDSQALFYPGLGSASLLDGERILSQALGIYWETAAAEDPDPYAPVIADLLRTAAMIPCADSESALIFAQRLVTPGSFPELDAAVARLVCGHPHEDWRADRAWFFEDSNYPARGIALAYDGPQPHELFAWTTRPGGRRVKFMGLVKAGMMSGSQFGDLGEKRQVDTNEALVDLREAMTLTDRRWPRLGEPSYAELRALVWSRVRSASLVDRN